MQRIPKPKEGEYAPYAAMYMKLVPDDGLLLQHFKENCRTMKDFVLSLPAEKLEYRYAEGKWTIKEILVHLMDGERVFTYRALCFARKDQTPLPGFEQDDYAPASAANNRTISNILEEYEAVRNSTIALFNGMDAEMLGRTGIANDTKVSVRALAFQIAGHEVHHLNMIKERYI